MSYLLLLKSKY